MIPRAYDHLEKYLKPQRVLVIYGPRRVGKTTLLGSFLKQTSLKYRLESGDNIRVQQTLGSQRFEDILEFAQGYDLIAIDEAQQIPNIGMGLKIIVDQIPGIRVIATGSSSFDLSHQVGEPLTGRKQTLELYPIAQMELAKTHNPNELKERLETYLVYGSYPEVVTASSQKQRRTYLREIADSYLMKDILALENIRNPRSLLDLLKLLAFQVGQEVSVHELGTQVGFNDRTVKRYLDLLEKTFVIVRSGGFSRNLRKEVTSKCKYYFVDNGIRNAVISQFNSLDSRNDIGALWENFIFIERIKKRAYSDIFGDAYFWRTYDQKEIDIIEERDGKLFGYECKWSEQKKPAPPKEWTDAYPNATYDVITPKNYLSFVG